MVFLTLTNLFRITRKPHPDDSWRKRWVFNVSQYMYGRRRNCYRIAIRAAKKALLHSTRSRALKPQVMQRLFETRIDAACREHGTNKNVMLEGLARCNIILDRKVLADLAIREPRTFKCIADVAAAKLAVEPPRGGEITDSPPPGIITRGML
uniref:Large ribosomal subunit protein bL20m n=1 Tax=Strigamia maritima TaxID=126957 RepID=T1IL78_STRMM